MLDMIQEYASFILFLFQVIMLHVKMNEIPIHNLHHVQHPLITERINTQFCYINTKWVDCSKLSNYFKSISSFTQKATEENLLPHYDSRYYHRKRNYNMKPLFTEAQPQRRLTSTPGTMIQARLPVMTYSLHHRGVPSANFFKKVPRSGLTYHSNTALNKPHSRPHAPSGLSLASQPTIANNSSSNTTHKQLPLKPPVTMGVQQTNNASSIDNFTRSLDNFERQFYKTSFRKLTAISPEDRQENGMSFVQSGFFLLLTLMTLSKEVDSNTKAEIDQCIGFKFSDVDSVNLVRHFITTLPTSSDKLKLRQSSRLMLWPGKETSPRFLGGAGAAAALMLRVERFNGTETSDKIAAILNYKVEMDSGGAIHDTFDEDDVSGGVTAVLVTTLYVRGRWRAAPTVLNGTRPFRDADGTPKRTVRMIRINDNMKYADLDEWDAQAIEISYATPGLTLLMLIPRSSKLQRLSEHVTNTSIRDITAKMKNKRVAAIIPIYTLRMTLLLPNKLEAMGITRLVDVSNVSQARSLRLSHAVQRIMFWAEAGRNAYKDDGIEWDQTPELEVVVDRPYIFFVRWHNVTLMNGHFVL